MAGKSTLPMENICPVCIDHEMIFVCWRKITQPRGTLVDCHLCECQSKCYCNNNTLYTLYIPNNIICLWVISYNYLPYTMIHPHDFNTRIRHLLDLLHSV